MAAMADATNDLARQKKYMYTYNSNYDNMESMLDADNCANYAFVFCKLSGSHASLPTRAVNSHSLNLILYTE